MKRGVLGDEAMRTSAPDICAVGDVCEVAQQVCGPWPVAVGQAKVAAINIPPDTPGDAYDDRRIAGPVANAPGPLVRV